MKWQGKRRSSNVEDRRGQSVRGSGGGINPALLIPLVRFLFSKKGLIVLGVFIGFSWLTGTNPLDLISQFTGQNPSASETATQSYESSSKEDELTLFSEVILASTEDVWSQIIPNYREPVLVLFSNSIKSACGFASSATGPFYCPADEKLYIDLSFFNDLEYKLNAPGDFAQAYVIAHEVGHHIQKISGITDQMDQLRNSMSKKEYNTYSVRLELQADFLAGVWAHYSQRDLDWLDVEDIDEALNAANAIGDDRLQKNATGQVVPDSFTHGTSAQRMRWFKKGFDSGDLNQGDTFNANPL